MRKDKMLIRKLATNIIKRISEDLQVSLNARLAEISADIVEEKWNAFKPIVYNVSKEQLSTALKEHKDWFDRNRSWKSLFMIGTKLGIIYSVRTPCLISSNIEHAENSEINGYWQNQLNSKQLQALMTPKVFTKV